MRIDLHAHTTASDGADSPRELVGHALAAGLDVLGLTDHDTTSGWREAKDAALGTGLRVLPGIELSCQVFDDEGSSPPRSIHLLGYLPDPTHPALTAEMDKIRHHRSDRLRLMVESLQSDYDITWEEVQAQMPPGATAGRPHIAQVLIDKGFFADTTEAFQGPLRADGPFHVPHYAPRLREGIRLIAHAGGVPILAHPYTGERSSAVHHQQGFEGILQAYQELAEEGLAGLEIDHRENTAEGKEVLRRVASELTLIVTGSSDYHGTKKPNPLGENLTAPAQLERILERASGHGVFS